MNRSLSVLLLALGFAASAQAADLTVNVTGVGEAKGEIFVSLYNKSDSWLKKPLKSAAAVAVKGTTTIVFANLPEGEYALSTFHDLDGDKKMGQNFFGYPNEPFGFSRDARGTMGPPSFDDAKIVLPAAGTTITFKLNS